MSATKVECPECHQQVTVTLADKFRAHGPKSNPCLWSGCHVPEEHRTALPPLPTATAQPADSSSESSSGSPAPVAESTTPAPTGADGANATGLEPIPGVDEYAQSLAQRQLGAYWTARLDGYEQPDRVSRLPKDAAQPMTPLGQQIATTLREIFYQYTNRSRRSQQTTLGPSQLGTPCDRRLVLHMLGAPKVNPGGDGWAAFAGTQIHRGLEDMMKWADAGQGRFATELRLQFNNPLVPGGTLDALDRTLLLVMDHKLMGDWSLDKLRRTGPTPVYRTQVHVYAYGARIRGEQVDHVALVAWPRQGSNLDDLYVWTEPYNPQVARDAFARLDGLKAWIDEKRAEGVTNPQIAASASISADCRFCPYHMPDAKDLTNGGCNGRQ